KISRGNQLKQQGVDICLHLLIATLNKIGICKIVASIQMRVSYQSRDGHWKEFIPRQPRCKFLLDTKPIETCFHIFSFNFGKIARFYLCASKWRKRCLQKCCRNDVDSCGTYTCWQC